MVSSVDPSEQRDLLCKPGTDRRPVLAGQQAYNSAGPVGACLHRLAPQLTVTDRSIWHGSGTRVVADTCFVSSTRQPSYLVAPWATLLLVTAQYRCCPLALMSVVDVRLPPRCELSARRSLLSPRGGRGCVGPPNTAAVRCGWCPAASPLNERLRVLQVEPVDDALHRCDRFRIQLGRVLTDFEFKRRHQGAQYKSSPDHTCILVILSLPFE